MKRYTITITEAPPVEIDEETMKRMMLQPPPKREEFGDWKWDWTPLIRRARKAGKGSK